jgi:hypothetical protein
MYIGRLHTIKPDLKVIPFGDDSEVVPVFRFESASRSFVLIGCV